MVALSRNVGSMYAMEILLTGDMVSARSAEEIGLVNRVVAAEALFGACQDLARRIASKSLMALATSKRAFDAPRGMSLSDAYAHASAVMDGNMLARGAEEGIGAFIEKRQPCWNDA